MSEPKNVSLRDLKGTRNEVITAIQADARLTPGVKTLLTELITARTDHLIGVHYHYSTETTAKRHDQHGSFHIQSL